MSILQWDHTVHYVNDLEQAITAFKNNGLTAFPGGSHKLWGTHNALSYFGLNYIEFLAIEDRELAESSDTANLVVKDAVNLLPEVEAFSRVAIRTDNIEETAASLKQQGLKLSPIMYGKRLNVQGQWIEWRMLTVGGNFQGLIYPFFIQWKGSDDERLAELKETGIITPHPAGEITVQQAIFSVSDPAATAAHWGQVFGLSAIAASSPSPSDGQGSVALAIGDKNFVFQQGDKQQLTQLVLSSESPSLQGRTIIIGEGEYVFT
ncbi:VOC family protein [Paenibacillus sp. 19GGS1-52]|uniref:VOC family protein n=1 Tax=Paenibacillus sp. 19GGS1-52 TaxID=2758563 RepID=UPI001EFA7679|nr:VOC family protein [Paenibacillus sp. 19GGS1-52]ULO06558.1 VOC family protein [Paenibacillus sp. 19GGS1-52]